MNLIGQHLRCKRSSRLPILNVAAIYNVAKAELDERVLKLTARNAVERRTVVMREIEIRLVGDDNVATLCEMKNKTVERGDIDRALQKIAAQGKHVQNYIFISPEAVVAEGENQSHLG